MDLTESLRRRAYHCVRRISDMADGNYKAATSPSRSIAVGMTQMLQTFSGEGPSGSAKASLGAGYTVGGNMRTRTQILNSALTGPSEKG
ncbi:hypothetical protein PBP221_70740 (plasmid) [Paraburkholderia sp. 22B1P]|nr:hypothetical protein PBP221_70740 [Paraburkholderia sp. 22B1P]